jgi:type I restriction enzyme, R subunit
MFLQTWDDKNGLSESFAPDEVEEKTEIVFQHLILSQRNEMAYNYA